MIEAQNLIDNKGTVALDAEEQPGEVGRSEEVGEVFEAEDKSGVLRDVAGGRPEVLCEGGDR